VRRWHRNVVTNGSFRQVLILGAFPPEMTSPFCLRMTLAAMALAAASNQVAAHVATGWTATWTAAPQLVEAKDLPGDAELSGRTLRQDVRISVGGERIRLRLSNEFGRRPLRVVSAHVALRAPGSAILAGSDRALVFSGRETTDIPPGSYLVSDPLSFPVQPLANLAITLCVQGEPDGVTGHPGSRTTSYLMPGIQPSSVDMQEGARMDHWYYIKGIDVENPRSPGAIAIIGDSITDGRGSTTNGNDRWPDQLAQRLAAHKGQTEIGVLNLGIGGNRLLSDGLGPNALSRLDRDVFAQPGVRWLVIAEGINDIGTAAQAREKGGNGASASDIIAALEQILARAQGLGIKVIGTTITPLGGSFYDLPGAEADRGVVNDWIRNSGRFDAVIDFDAAVRNPSSPRQLLPEADTGDHVHLTPLGYRKMAEAVDLSLFLTD